jgi:hypothetical protein
MERWERGKGVAVIGSHTWAGVHIGRRIEADIGQGLSDRYVDRGLEGEWVRMARRG